LPSDFAAALCDPIAYQSQYEKRQQQLASLMDEEEEEIDGDVSNHFRLRCSITLHYLMIWSLFHW